MDIKIKKENYVFLRTLAIERGVEVYDIIDDMCGAYQKMLEPVEEPKPKPKTKRKTKSVD